MPNKIRKHQPNAAALIHNFCNGADVEMKTKASVSALPNHPNDGDSTLYSYRTPIAVRRRHNGRVWFHYNCRHYSVTTGRHQGRFICSVPNLLPFIHPSELCERNEDWFIKWKDRKDELFSRLDKEFSEQIKRGSFSVVFYDDKGTTSNASAAFRDDAAYIRGQKEAVLMNLFNASKKKPRQESKFRWAFDDLLKEYRQGQLLSLYAKEFAPSQKEDVQKFRRLLRKEIASCWDKLLKGYQRHEAERRRRTEEMKAKFRWSIGRIREWHNALTDCVSRELQKWRDGGLPEHNSAERLAVCARIREELHESWFTGLNHVREAAGLFSDEEWRTMFPNVSPSELCPTYVGSVTALRVKDEVVQTTRHAEVPLSVAALVWKAHGDTFRRAAETRESLEFNPPLRVGLFYMDKIDAGVVCIGCHRIDAAEVVQLATRLGWE